MQKKSAGILVYRYKDERLQILLIHPGGPFFLKKDTGVWSIPKGEYSEQEEPLEVAKREFFEETGNTIASANLTPLTPVRIKSGKTISVWAVEADFDPCYICSNEFEIEWPPKSGKMQSFPETDKAEWFDTEEALLKIHPGQAPIIRELKIILDEI